MNTIFKSESIITLLRVMFCALLIVGFASCKDDGEVVEPLGAGEVVRIQGTAITGLENGRSYVCESADEVRSLLGKDTPGNVDFNENVIILVKDTANYGVADINATLIHSAAGYDINVAVALNFTTVMEPWCIGVVMPRTGDMTTNLTIEYVQ